MKAKIIKIGNSKGIRIPKTILEEAQLSGEVELEVEGNTLLVKSVRPAREKWAESFQRLSEKMDDLLLDDTIENEWDQDNWQWA